MNKHNYNLEKFQREVLELTRRIETRANLHHLFHVDYSRDQDNRRYSFKIGFRSKKTFGTPIQYMRLTPSDDGKLLRIYILKAREQGSEIYTVPLTRILKKNRTLTNRDTTDCIVGFVRSWVDTARNNYMYAERVTKEQILMQLYKAIACCYSSAVDLK